MHIDHIFFDLDHTLWDFETNSAQTFNFILKAQKVEIDLALFLAIYSPINKKYWKLYREEKVSKSELRYKRLKETFDLLNYKISDAKINILAEIYIEHLPNYNSLFDDCHAVLEYLAPKYQMHIITNGFEEIQVKKLKNSKIDHFFDKIITSESVGVKKPNPRIFNHALELTNCKAEKSVMIGDSLEADIQGARSLGMHTIFFNSHNETIEHDTIGINKLIEIKHHL